MSKEKDIFDINLEKEAPLLNGIPKSNPFTVPDGYFDALPAQIMEKCRESNRRIPAFIPGKIFWLYRPQWMLAVFVAIVAISFFVRQGAGTINTNYDSIAAAIPDSVIVQSLQNNIDLVDVSSLEELSQNAGNIGSLPQQTMQDSTNGPIINFLINNNVDANDIENEL